MIGILGGFYFYQIRVVGTDLSKKLFWWLPQKDQRSTTFQEVTKCVLWLVLTILALWDVTAAVPSYNGNLFTANGAATYQGLGRWLWSIYVLWIIVACEEGWAPALNVSTIKHLKFYCSTFGTKQLMIFLLLEFIELRSVVDPWPTWLYWLLGAVGSDLLLF